MSNSIAANDETHREITKKINTPFGLSTIEKLGIFHEGFDENDGTLSSSRSWQKTILSFEVYLKLEEELTLRQEDQDRFKQELEHIHNKMLFDSFNEALDALRPFDLKGMQISE